MLWKHCPKTVVHQDINVSTYPPHRQYDEMMTLLIYYTVEYCHTSHKKIGKHSHLVTSFTVKILGLLLC